MLHIADIEKSFGALQILKKVNIEARQGEFLALLGPSGCGKSTLLSIIAGLAEPTNGDVLIDGHTVTDLDPKDRDIAMVFQSYALYPSMTVAENLSFGMKVRKVPAPERERAVADVARILQLEPLLERRPSQLSGGQRQRVAMGRALVRQPKVFLFDEPLSNLDAQLRVEMRTELKKLHARLGATIVYVTHDQVEAMTLATKVVVMQGGVVQQVGAPQAIYDKPANTFVARFIGSPSMNLLNGTIDISGDQVRVALGSGTERMMLATRHTTEVVRRRHGDPVILGVRPEAIVHEEGAPDRANVVDVTIDIVEPTGSDNLAVFRLGGQEALARLKPLSCAPGDAMQLRFPPEKLLMYNADSKELIA